MDAKRRTAFRRKVMRYYARQGRHDLPWRRTRDPYRILISEVMLQQTQVPRVIPKYRAFLQRFPTVEALARAPLKEVLIAWQGLGYNRRARLLREAAQVIAEQYHGRVPRTEEALTALPGVGMYTARAVLAFAYNQPVALLETNIRTVLFHELIPHTRTMRDAELLDLVATVLPSKNPREWYWALMDYGSMLKARGVRTNARAKEYRPQKPFRGSDRQIRGALVRALIESGRTSLRALTKTLPFPPARIKTQVRVLRREGLVSGNARGYELPRS